MIRQTNLRVWTAMITVYIVWGSTYLAIRFAVETMPPFLMAATRFLIAGGLLFAWRMAAGDRLPTWRQLRDTAIVGLFLLLGGNGLVVWAEQRVVSGVAALLIGATPFWFVIVEAVRPGGKRPGWKTVAGLAVGFAGITLLIGPDQFSGAAEAIDLLGSVALILAALLWAIGSIYGRDADLPSSPMLTTSLEMLCGGLGLLLFGSLLGEWGRLEIGAITTRSYLSLAYLVVFGSLVGFASYVWLLKNAPTPLVSTYAYVNPLVAIFLGNLLAQEPLTGRILLAALIIVGAVMLVNTSQAGAPKQGRRVKASVLPKKAN